MSAAKSDALLAQDGTVVVEENSTSRKYLTFMVNDGDRAPLKFGVDSNYVVEIMNNYVITYLPMMPHYIPGIFNMRGQIIPIMDVRLRMDKEANGNGLLIVLDYNSIQIGIVVDSVDRILDIEEDSIGPVPSQDSQRFVCGICAIPDDSTVMILDCESLLSND